MTLPSPFRARWLKALALASDGEIERAVLGFDAQPDQFEMLRAPEVGLVMAKARAGGSGAPFHLGEVTVTRCAVRSPAGLVGIGWVQGRRPERAAQIARLDAVFQAADPAHLEPVIDRLDAALADRRAAVARKAAATKVEFFTLVRGED